MSGLTATWECLDRIATDHGWNLTIGGPPAHWSRWERAGWSVFVRTTRAATPVIQLATLARHEPTRDRDVERLYGTEAGRLATVTRWLTTPSTRLCGCTDPTGHVPAHTDPALGLTHGERDANQGDPLPTTVPGTGDAYCLCGHPNYLTCPSTVAGEGTAAGLTITPVSPFPTLAVVLEGPWT